MATVPQGKKTVANAATRVQLQAAPQGMNGILFQALPANTGNIYIGDSTVVGSTLVGCMLVLGPGQIAVIGGKYLSTSALNNEDPSKFWLDADVNGEGVLWSIIQ